MTRQLIVLVVLLLGLGTIHMAGTQRPLWPDAAKVPNAWLGPLPPKIDDAGLPARWAHLLDRMAGDARDVDVRRFTCRSPAEVGALPMMASVVRYIDALPRGQDDEALVDGLTQAAARGNWLARTLMIGQLSNKDDPASGYRLVQLAEWLYQQRLGQVYTDLENPAPGSTAHHGTLDNDPSGFLAAAAMRHDYVAQARIGSALAALDDPELVGAGGRMLACAAQARAFYRDVLRTDSSVMAAVRATRHIAGRAAHRR